MNIYYGLLLFHCWMLGKALGACPNRDGCACSFGLIDCSGRNLGFVPTFSTLGQSYQTFRLDNNHIVKVPNGSLGHFTVSDVLLNNNTINEVEHAAFAGLETHINELDLSANNLADIPTAIGTLKNIRRLNIAFNPINSLHFDAGEDVLRHIGKTLFEFTFGDDALHEWPHILRHLVTLKTLNVLAGSFKTLSPSAFHGFEGTLLNLRIENTALIAIPVALSKLMYLERLNFDHNHLIGDAGILVPAFSSTILKHLNDLTLKDDRLTVFPNILNYLDGVRKLSLEGNKLDVIGDNSIKVIASSKVEDLSLKNCNLTRVPGAISRMRNLTVLDLSDNKISTFEWNDFMNMSKIENLNVSDNPLLYISPDAFNELHNLTYLNLQNTFLIEIPTAIKNSPRLLEIILPRDQISCTCDLAWLREYMDNNGNKTKIQGTCETILSSVQDYLFNFIKFCPNYGHVRL